MKRYLVFLCVFFIGFSYLKADIFVETSNDSITIWDTKACEHCAIQVEFLVHISNDTITIVEHDTMPDWTTCVCYRDFSITLIGLDIGDYYVEIYRKYSAVFMNTDSLYYIGSTRFNYNPVSQREYIESYYQSNCYQIDSIEENMPIIENLQLISIYPNPFNSSTIIKYFIENNATNIRISIFDIQGKLIDVIEEKSLESGYHELVWEPSNIPSGFYIIKLSGNDISQSQRVLYLK